MELPQRFYELKLIREGTISQKASIISQDRMKIYNILYSADISIEQQ